MVYWWVAMKAQGCLEWERWSGCIESLWHWGWDSHLEDFRSGGRKAVDYPLHAKIRLLELVGDRSKDCLEVGSVIDDCGCGYFESPICVSVDCCGEGAEFFVKFVL